MLCTTWKAQIQKLPFPLQTFQSRLGKMGTRIYLNLIKIKGTWELSWTTVLRADERHSHLDPIQKKTPNTITASLTNFVTSQCVPQDTDKKRTHNCPQGFSSARYPPRCSWLALLSVCLSRPSPAPALVVPVSWALPLWPPRSIPLPAKINKEEPVLASG